MAAVNNHRQNREMNQLTIDAKKQSNVQGQQRNALYSQYGGSVQNRQNVAQQMYSVDPAAAAKMEEGIRSMKGDERKEMEFITTQTAKIAAGLLNTPDAQFDGVYKAKLMQVAQRYPDAVNDAPDMNATIQEKKAWLQQQVNEASTLQEILDRNAPQKAQTAKDANGYLRNVATGERVFEGVEKAPDEPKAETFGQPVEVMGPDGKAMFIRVGNNGTTQPLGGYSPIQKQSNAPKLVSLFDEKTGQPYKAKYNNETGQYDRVGGTKAVEKQGGEEFKREEKLRGEFIKLSKDFRSVRDAYGRINASAKDPSAAGDLALIFNYMKVLDPGSTVREGEFATAQNSAGVPERIRARLNSVMSGERLGEATRQDFVSRAQSLYQQQESFFNQNRKHYSTLAESYGLNPDNITVDFTQGVPEQAPTDGLPQAPRKGEAVAENQLDLGTVSVGEVVEDENGKWKKTAEGWELVND